MSSETKYVRSGQIHIAYQVTGDGPIDVIYVPGWVSHVELAWEEPLLARFLARLASFSRLITFDKRGTGLSDRVPLDDLPTMGERMDDLKAVMDAVGSKKAAVIGFSEGGNLSALFAATYPERVTALVMFGTFAKRIWSPDYPWAPTPEQRERDYDLVENNWGREMDIAHYVPSKMNDPEFIQRLTTYFRRSASPSAAVALLRMNTQIDIRRVLPYIHAPTMVMHRTGDRDVNVEEGKWIAERIPNATFVELPGEDHMPWVGDQDSILDAIEEFLTGVPPTGDFDRVLTTVLFTDIVGSTELIVEMGDEAWRRILTDHNRVVREKLRQFKGQEIDTTGDGFLIAFDAPARALSCAQNIIASTQAMGLELRIGIHTGEVHKVGADMTGIAVHIAARILDKAESGEIYVSESTKCLVPDSSFHFVEKGNFKLKGVPEEKRLYTVI